MAELKRQMSGSDTASPRNPKMFPIQRCRSGRLLGMKSIRIAPTSGVNKIVLKMWLSEKSIHIPRLYLMYGVTRHIKVVAEKSNQADYDYQHVALDQSILNQADRIAENPDDARGQAHRAIDDPG